MNVQPFTAGALSQSISVTSTASTSVALPGQGNVVRVVNIGPNEAYLSIGTGAQTATVASGTANATSTVILAGTDISLSIPNSVVLNISAICASTKSATLVVQVGEGV